jgi:hypothetical protein
VTRTGVGARIAPGRCVRTAVPLVVAAALASAAPTAAQAVIKVNDDVNLRFGVLGQFWGDTITDPINDDQTQNLFIRRIRLITGGQVTKNVTFFIETDAPNLGRASATKNSTPSVIVQDAFASFSAPHNYFILDAGLMFVPFSRNSIQSAATLLPIDYGANTFTQSTPTQSSTGRDTGFQARGYLAQQRLEYRAGVFQGAREPGSNNAFRYAGRVQFNFLDPEVGFFYTGTYLGKKRIVAIGAAFDRQSDYRAYDVDGFVDLPMWHGAITGQFNYNRFDGRSFLAIPRQNTYLAEAGFFIRAVKGTPFVQWTNRDPTSAALADEDRTAIGAAYWWAAHNATIKAAYTRISPSIGPRLHEWTVQFQIFYY